MLDILALIFAKLNENQFSILDVFAISQKKTLAGGSSFLNVSRVVPTKYHRVSGLSRDEDVRNETNFQDELLKPSKTRINDHENLIAKN